jgi:hypothetical protein
MEQQLIVYNKIYDEWKEMDRKEQIKTIEKITGKVKINELGMSAMLDILCGGKAFKD